MLSSLVLSSRLLNAIIPIFLFDSIETIDQTARSTVGTSFLLASASSACPNRVLVGI
jgi:hypothetical protein